MRTWLLYPTFFVLVAGVASGREVFVEAESFAQPGGWVVDQQVMDQMGSAFLLAHGLGVPVQDATTTVEFPQAGRYRLWVRTRDWVAPWKTPQTPTDMQATGTPGVKAISPSASWAIGTSCRESWERSFRRRRRARFPRPSTFAPRIDRLSASQ